MYDNDGREPGHHEDIVGHDKKAREQAKALDVDDWRGAVS